MAGYATTSGYGYYRPPAPQQQPASRRLALAASGKPSADDPFGLVYQHSPGVTAPAAAPARTAAAGPTPSNGLAGAPGSLTGLLGLAGFNGIVPGFSTDALGAIIPPGSTGTGALKPFDINTDPTYQEAVNLAGKSDAEAQAGALKAKQDALLAYGDPNLSKTVLGDDTLAQAAANNPTSTLADLARQRGQQTHDLTENLNKDNLAFGGYRITQEGQLADNYQNALATAAANVNGALGGIDSQLGSALDSNQNARIQAALAAYAAHKGDTGGTDVTPPADTTGGSGSTDTIAPPPAGAGTPDDSYQTLLALAALGAKRTAVGA